MTNKKKHFIIAVTALLMIIAIVCLVYAKQRFDAYHNLSPDEKVDYQGWKQFKKQNNLSKEKEEAIWYLVVQARNYVRKDLVEWISHGTETEIINPHIYFDNLHLEIYSITAENYLFKTFNEKLDCIIINGRFWSQKEGNFIPFTYYFGYDQETLNMLHTFCRIEMTPEKNSRFMWKLLYGIDIDEFLDN